MGQYPEFIMQVVDKQDTVNSIVVVVGEPKNATPVVANKKMHNVIFSPVWNIPVDIAYEEMEYILEFHSTNRSGRRCLGKRQKGQPARRRLGIGQ